MIGFLSDPPMQWISVGSTVGTGLALAYLIAKRRLVAAVVMGGATASIAAGTYDLFQWGNSNNAFTFFATPATAFVALLVNAVMLLGVMVYLATQRLAIPTLSMFTLAVATVLVSMGHGRAATPAAQGWDTSTICAFGLTAALAVITLLEAGQARRRRSRAQANAA